MKRTAALFVFGLMCLGFGLLPSCGGKAGNQANNSNYIVTDTPTPMPADESVFATATPTPIATVTDYVEPRVSKPENLLADVIASNGVASFVTLWWNQPHNDADYFSIKYDVDSDSNWQDFITTNPLHLLPRDSGKPSPYSSSYGDSVSSQCDVNPARILGFKIRAVGVLGGTSESDQVQISCSGYVLPTATPTATPTSTPTATPTTTPTATPTGTPTNTPTPTSTPTDTPTPTPTPTPITEQPDPPSNLMGVFEQEPNVTLSWTEASSVEGFRVKYKLYSADCADPTPTPTPTPHRTATPTPTPVETPDIPTNRGVTIRSDENGPEPVCSTWGPFTWDSNWTVRSNAISPETFAVCNSNSSISVQTVEFVVEAIWDGGTQFVASDLLQVDCHYIDRIVNDPPN
ncbi:MAG: hypothetical protein V1495_10130 [Pseudomonadota bacterium]